MAQTVIRISCTDQTLKTIEAPVVSSGGIGENKVIFDFCPLWEGFSKIAVFSLNEDTPYQAVIGTDNSCVIPAEPLMSQGNLYIGVYGVNADGVKRTTSLLKYKVAQGALEGVKPTEPTPDIYEQILSKIADVAYPEVPVQSVNGKSGKVVLTPEDIGAQPAGNYLIGETDPTVPAWAKEATKPKYTAGEVGAEERGATNTHNTSPDAHNDLRLLIEGLTSRFNAVFDSTDIDLDQMSEIVAYIKDNASLIESVTTSKVNVSDIVDNLTTNVKEKPLSAAQGVVLKDLIDKLQSAVNDKVGARHEHSATEITSGILPVSRGGTGMSTGQNPNAVINLNGEGDCFNALPTKSGALYATTDNGVPSFGTLPLAQGGTGATTAEMARASLGAAAATHSHSITELGDLSLATSTADGLMSKEDKIKFDDLDTNLETVSDIARKASADVKEFREDFAPHISNTANPHSVTAEQVGALPLGGGTLTGAITLPNNTAIKSKDGSGTAQEVVRVNGSNQIVMGASGVFDSVVTYQRFVPATAAVNTLDIGGTDRRFRNLYLSGKLSDGTNSVSVANIAQKSDIPEIDTEAIYSSVSEARSDVKDLREDVAGTYETKTDAASKLSEAKGYTDSGVLAAKSYTDEKILNLVGGAPDALNTLDELAAALKDNAGIVDTLNEAIGKKANASDLTNLQAQVNKKANDYSIEIYNGTGGNPKPVRFASFNYSTCNSENGIAAKISMVSGHGNGSSYAFLEDAIIRVSYLGSVEVDNFKYYGAATGNYDGANRQYGDIFWLIDTTNKIVDFYVLMGQYARVYQTPWKRLTYSTGGTVTQHTSCTVYSSGTKVWANNSDIALMSDIPSIDTEAIYNSVSEAKSDVKDLREDFSPHLNNTSNPHNVTASQTGALPLAGGLMNGSIKFQSSSLPQKTLQYICGIDAFADGGEMGWQSKGDFLAGCLTTAHAGTDGILPVRLRSCQDHNNVISDPNSATATGFYYVSGTTNRPSFSQSTNTDYRVLTTAYSDQWLQQIATDFRCTDVFVRRCQQGSWTSWLKLAYSSEIEDVANTALSAKSDVKDMRESLAGYETTSGASNKLLEAKAYTNTGVQEAKTYTDTAISNLINSAPTTLDTLGEIATAMQNNADVVTALEQSIGNKANSSDLTSHTGNKSNPHGVTASQVGALSTEGGTLTGTLIAPTYKGDTSPAAIKPSDSNEVNFGSNANYIYFGYDNRVGSPGAVNTYKFGTHSGAGGATSGKIECGEIVEGGTTLSSKYAPASLSTTVETLADSVREAQSDIKDMREEVIPLSRGGTGTSLAKTNNAIIRFSGSGNYFSKTATASGAMYATSANGAPTFGTLPIAQGGTGATDATTALSNLGGLPLSGGRLSGSLDFTDGTSWITPFLLAFKNASAGPATYPYTGFYQWGDEWQVNARDASNTFVHNIMAINLVSKVANFSAVPTVNGSQLALKSDVPTTAAQVGALSTGGGTLTGPVTYSTASGNAISSNYISAGGGYSPNTGKYGVKLICCDQVDCQTGLGQDLTALPGGYELSIAGGRNAAGDTGYISFAMHSVNSTSYDRLGYFDNGGNFYTKGKLTQGSPSADGTVSSMNRLQSDLFVEGNGSAPNNPRVAGFYLGKSATDENRHMDIVSGDTYSYIDFNKAGNNVDYDVRLLVNVDNGYTDFTWDGSKTARVLNVQGAIQQYGQAVALKSELDALAARIAALETAPVITFTINGTAYSAEQGMTWGAWVYSKYNTAGAKIHTDTRILTSAFVATDYGIGYQCDTDVIVAGKAYVISA